MSKVICHICKHHVKTQKGLVRHMATSRVCLEAQRQKEDDKQQDVAAAHLPRCRDIQQFQNDKKRQVYTGMVDGVSLSKKGWFIEGVLSQKLEEAIAFGKQVVALDTFQQKSEGDAVAANFSLG